MIPFVALVVVLAGAAGHDDDRPTASSTVRVNTPLADFGLKDLGGEPVRLSQFRGTPVVIVFFASWCNPCERELPLLDEVWADRDGDVAVLAVSYDDLERDSRAFADRLDLRYPVLLDVDNVVRKLYGVHGIPQTFFVDARGVLREKVYGLTSRREVERSLDALLAYE